jgi:hypothetical protein
MYSTLVHPVRGQPFLVEHLDCIEDVIENAEFLNEGWRALSDPSGARCDMDWNGFMHIVMQATCTGIGTVVMFKSKNRKPLGYMVLLDDTEAKDSPGLFIYFGFSNGKYEGAPEASIDYVKTWAKGKGFKYLRAQTRRINGASMRLFKKKLGFKPKAMVFETTL